MTIAKSNTVVPRFHFKKTDYQKHHVIPRKVMHHFGNKTYTVRLSAENHKIAHLLLNISYAQKNRKDLYTELGYGIKLTDCSYVRNIINNTRVCKKGDVKWLTLREVYSSYAKKRQPSSEVAMNWHEIE